MVVRCVRRPYVSCCTTCLSVLWHLELSWKFKNVVLKCHWKIIEIFQGLSVGTLLGNKLQWNFNRNYNIFSQENAFEDVVRKLVGILTRPQCVNTLWPIEAWKPSSILAQVIDCCLTVPSHYPNWFWAIISEVLWQSHGDNYFTRYLSHQC